MATETRAEPSLQPGAEEADRLRADVGLLGRLVGEVLREQGGAELFAAVEYVRNASIAARANGHGAAQADDAMMAWAEAQPTGRLLQLVRAFGVYFHVINLAEQYHRVRTLAHREQTGIPMRESIGAAVDELRRAGIAEAALRATVQELEVHPVFTAHPSEARRRTLLHHLELVSGLIEQLDRHQAPRAREALLDELRLRITLIWQTAEARTWRPSVIDEVQSILYFLVGTVYDTVPWVYRELGQALGESALESWATMAPTLLRFGSWVGADGDGNPAVTGEVTLAAARLARHAVLRRYRDEVQALGRDLSISARLVGALPELVASVEADRTELGMQPVREWADEPYRRKLGLIAERLRRTDNGEPGGYSGPEGLIDDLRLVQESLRAHGGQRIAGGGIKDLRRRVEVLGFHVAELEIRRHADRQAEAVAELLALGGAPGYLQLDQPARAALLNEKLIGSPPTLPREALSAGTREFIAAFEALAAIQRMSGERACQTYIVSMSRAPSDALAALFLAREAGLFEWDGQGAARSRVDIVPLFEQIDELNSCGLIMDALLACPPYRAAVAARGERQQVMVGYSDSNKDGGYLAASWHTYRAQALLAAAAEHAGVSLLVFHGRGGAIGRGGGPMNRAIQARPPEARAPRLKVTEQGEVITARYSSRAIAERHFEQLIHALLLSALAPEEEEHNPQWTATLERLADSSRAHYEALVKESPALLRFFRQATPFPELGTLNLASRPVSRSAARGEIALDDLRAIPWVFSWTQVRANLPGWFGTGTALRDEIAAGGLAQLQAMYRHWRFFATTLDNAQRSLGTADMSALARYATLSGQENVYQQIVAEYEISVSTVLQVTRQSEILEQMPVIARSIKLRNPYVDALHLAQIALLRRYRELSDDASPEERANLLDAIHHSINGIAAGLQTTG